MRFVSEMGFKRRPIHKLDPARIIETAENLAERLNKSFPGSNLAGLGNELVTLAKETDTRVSEAVRPIRWIRLASALMIVLGLLGLSFLMLHVHTRWEFATVAELFQATDAGFNLVILLVGALWFLITLESRIKRAKALEAIQELREFIQVIDITQLYRTPELYLHETKGEHALDHTYLLFCTQMFGVITNLAALYARGSAGDSVLRAAFDVEVLANSTTTKLLTKAEMVRNTNFPPSPT